MFCVTLSQLGKENFMNSLNPNLLNFCILQTSLVAKGPSTSGPYPDTLHLHDEQKWVARLLQCLKGISALMESQAMILYSLEPVL